MTVAEIATLLIAYEKTIYRLVTKGEILGLKVIASWRFQRKVLDKWFQAKKEATTQTLYAVESATLALGQIT
jgi:excisionase family DNA binding protein